jgi:hypothetical protein
MNAETKVKANSLHASMAAAFAEIEAATKGAENPAFKQGGKASKYANLGAVIDAVKPALISHGLFVTQHCHPDPDGVSVETVLHHCGGESLSLGTLYVPANKKDPQGFGSALTYARRYAFQTAFVVPTEDDDGNAAVASMRNAPREVPTGPVSDGQWATLVQLSQAAGVSAERLCKFFEVNNLKELPAARYDEAVEKLNVTIQKKVKKSQPKPEPEMAK